MDPKIRDDTLVKIYTKTGDAGETGLIGGIRVRKNDIRIEAYGTVDELNACLGVARTNSLSPSVGQILNQVQDDLFYAGAALATPNSGGRHSAGIEPEHVARLEAEIDEHDAQLEPLQHFILPGGTTAAAQLHLARTVCRRAERSVLSLSETQAVPPQIIVYLNRLSDLLFVLARYENKQTNTPDVRWVPR